jgi:hypothetical protein
MWARALLVWLLIRWVHASGNRALLGIGALWVALTVAFETSLGRLMGLDWSRIVADYDFRSGGLMGIGLFALLFTPVLAARLRRGGDHT